jgi:hypothetical protein
VYTEAAAIASECENSDEIDIPSGLYSHSLEQMIKESARLMLGYNHQEMVKLLTNIAWSTMVLSHKNRQNDKNPSYVVTWNAYVDLVNKLT